MKFGEYELLERVAVGGMAEVFRGRVAGAEGFEKWVAIKRILPEFAKDDRFISMMLTEARIHSALSHRNIVQIHDLGISKDGEYFIVLEYVEGHDLRAIMEAAAGLGVQIPDSLALHIADELAQALHFAHELRDAEGQPLGIIHRDVSPSNVLISNSGEVKLSDFGIAKRRRDHSVVGSLKGNLVYMSPEQARRVPLDRRTDVFSLGAVLFEMLTGAKIREVTNEVNGFREAASGVVRSAREVRADIPEAYEQLLARALAADPAERFQDAASFGAAIRELQRGNERPVAPADVQELIELLNPPRRARDPVDLSKVIRLGPEFRMNPSPTTEEAGASEPLVVLAPSLNPENMTPRVRTATESGMGAQSSGPTPNGLSLPTPGITPPPPVVSRTPVQATPPPPQPQAMTATPPPPLAPRMAPKPGPSTLRFVAPTAMPMSPWNPGSLTPGPTPPPHHPAAEIFGNGHGNGGQETPPPPLTGMQHTRRTEDVVVSSDIEGEFAATPAPRSGAHPISGWSAPPQVMPLAPAADVLRSRTPGQYIAAPTLPQTGVIIREPKKAGSAIRSVVLVFLVILAGAGAVVHFKVMPLEILAVWVRPAKLSIVSEPGGATVTLDGRAVSGLTPIQLEVKRDRQDHVVEFTRAGFLPDRAQVRFDRTIPLDVSVALKAEPPPPPPPAEPVAKEAAAAEENVAEAAKAEPPVVKKSAKQVAKEARLAKAELRKEKVLEKKRKKVAAKAGGKSAKASKKAKADDASDEAAPKTKKKKRTKTAASKKAKAGAESPSEIE